MDSNTQQAAERRRGWRESQKFVDYPARSPYGDDGGGGRQRIDDAMKLADAYLELLASGPGDALSYDDMCYLSRLFNAHQGGQDTHRWQRINEWFKRQIAALCPEKGPVT